MLALVNTPSASLLVELREVATDDPFVSGRAVLIATTRFHDPAHAAEWSDPDIDATLDGVWSLILVGLSPRNIPQ